MPAECLSVSFVFLSLHTKMFFYLNIRSVTFAATDETSVDGVDTSCVSDLISLSSLLFIFIIWPFSSAIVLSCAKIRSFIVCRLLFMDSLIILSRSFFRDV